jgi:PAS domain S-box-containing protein
MTFSDGNSRKALIPRLHQPKAMKFSPWPISRYERISQVFGVLVVLISGAALVGWFKGSVTLKGIGAGYIPMAPNTALVFLLLGAILATLTDKSTRSISVAKLVIILAMAMVVARLSEFLTGVELGVDHWIFRFPAERLGLAPVGKMAFFTAMTFLLLGAAFFLLALCTHRWANNAGQGLSVVVTFIGLTFSLGYLYGAPLMYGGRSIPMALNTAICFFLSGTGLLVKSSVRDISERRAAREVIQKAHDELEARVKERTAELCAQQEFLRAIVDTSPNAIFVKDSKGRFTLVNKAVEAAYGRPAEDILGLTEADLNGNHNETQTFFQDDTEVIQTLRPKFIPEEQLTNPMTGETRSFQTMKVPLKLPGSDTVHILGVATDITERKQAEQALRETEEQLRQSQKLEGIGKLAGGIAHDFNNLLTVIGGYSDLLLMNSGLDESAREKMEEVKKAAERASSLTRQLLAFSRKQVLKPEVLNLNSLVDGLGKMLRRLIGEDIEIITALRPEVEKINADPGQIEQVAINLVVNARDAMPSGGKITIETANVELDQAYSDMHISIKPGPYVMLAVSDTGTGMDAKTRKRIFEPFFTTKEMGRGTGLGLSTIYGIVKQSGGNIWVYSELGKGTTFKIYFPQINTEQTAKTPAGKRPQEPLTEVGETILLVEDEEVVRRLTHSLLETSGYQVLAASGGEDAIRICASYSGEIHLMLTDVVMPRMNGKKVAEGVKLTRPEMEILYMSGYTDDAIVHHGVLEAGTNFIEKPFTSYGLLSKVRETLNKARDKKEGAEIPLLGR